MLIKCPECELQVSDKALSCPHCGYPMKPEIIKKIRKEKDLTQQALADQIGIKQNSVALIESGKRNASDQVILAICRECHVREEWLRSGEGDMFAPSPSSALDALAAERGLSRGEVILVEKLLELKPEVRQAILDYIVGVAAAVGAEGVPVAQPAPPPDPAAELHAELDRQLAMEKEAGAKSEAS